MTTVAGSFDELADAYARFRTGYAEEVFDALVAYGVAPGSHVVDIGCGTGLVTGELVRHGCRAVGVDLSEAMLAHARRNVPSAEFLRAPAEALPFEAGRFDAATSAQAFHWFDQTRALAELVRVVRSGGTAAVWWKALMRGDSVSVVRQETIRELGLEPPPDLLAGGFPAFEAAPFVDRRLRVIPWIVTTTVEAYLGYERSRARALALFGDGLQSYLERLAQRLGAPAAPLRLTYLHHLYLGRVAGSSP